ncbi:AAA family ATPase [Lunatibacter salilacus]|uniref:AAA family ATPase n=1 Tax=Lunatibacter salilacus TaxID=2483804 RepID=UPI00131CC5FB|nr:AAA family ATPase [Lunatibacter salilacus]
MYLNKIHIKNIRSISNFEMNFENPAGWHVIIGDNGAGKSTIVRSISLGIIGPNDAKALRLNLNDWVRRGEEENGIISLTIQKNNEDNKIGKSRPRTKPFEATLTLSRKERNGYVLEGNKGAPVENIWSNANGWFSCAFGPFRRFTGGEKEWMKVYYSDPRAAAHLSVFGEDVALTEAIDWLKNLHIKTLEKASFSTKTVDENESDILASLKAFLNEGDLLPHGAKLDSISSDGVFFVDGNGATVDVTQMSDGYRSILSLTFELIRQMVRSYGQQEVFKNFKKGDFTIDLPGVVLIDEIDAHLHPSWQARIGEWFLKVFPGIQFIVTTHSPLICRASENGTIWRLRAPGSDLSSGEITGTEKERLIFGDLLDAYGTELFGKNITQSQSGQDLTEKLAQLNLKSFKQKLTSMEQEELEHLKTITSNFSDVVSK